jgi:hypothetical protein
MVTVVWGEWYLKAHLELNLPTLLADRNLPSFCTAAEVTYVIMTRLADVDTIRKAPAIHALSQLMQVDIRVIAESETANPIAAHQRAWARATDEAKQSGQWVLYMPPDVAWSNGSFQHLAKLLADGYVAVFMTYLRVVSETFMPAARRHVDPSGTRLALSGRELVALSLRHVHPLMAAHMHDSPYFPIHPEMVVWPVAGEGVAVRCLAREMFLFDPNRIDISQQLLVGGMFDRSMLKFVDDSDDLYAVSLAPLGKDVEWHLTPGPPDMMAVARWWLTYDSPVNDVIASSCLRWHHRDMTPSRWSRIERASALWIRRAMALREGMRVWQDFVDSRSWSAAALTALLLRMSILPRALKHGAGLAAVVFVPSEHVLRRLETALPDELGTVERVGAALRRHVVFEQTWPILDLAEKLAIDRNLTLRSVAGAELAVRRNDGEITVDGVRVVGKGRRVGRHVIYVIDGLLGAPAMSQAAEARA